MPLDPHEVNSLYLSGTVRIPHSPPMTGDIYLIRHIIPGTQVKQDFLRVVHEVHDGLRFTYLLRVKDVRAVKLTATSEVRPLIKTRLQARRRCVQGLGPRLRSLVGRCSQDSALRIS